MKNTKFIALIGSLVVIGLVSVAAYAFTNPMNNPSAADSSAGALIQQMAGSGFDTMMDSLAAVSCNLQPWQGHCR